MLARMLGCVCSVRTTVLCSKHLPVGSPCCKELAMNSKASRVEERGKVLQAVCSVRSHDGGRL